MAENRGTGFRLMERELRDSGMNPPVVRDSVAMFSLTFEKRDGATESLEPGRMIGSYLAANGPSTASEMSEELGMARSTLNYRLKKLIAEGKVALMEAGRSRNQRYRLIR